jgi:DNA-binding transcriptional ArsR family regulator
MAARRPTSLPAAAVVLRERQSRQRLQRRPVPTAEPEALDAVFHALAHPARRQLLDLVRAAPGCNVNDVCRPFALSRIAVMKHLRVLEEAGLLISRKSGRSRELYFNVVPIQQIYERWTSEYGALWARRLLDLKQRVEGQRPTSEANVGANSEEAPT